MGVLRLTECQKSTFCGKVPEPGQSQLAYHRLGFPETSACIIYPISFHNEVAFFILKAVNNGLHWGLLKYLHREPTRAAVLNHLNAVTL